MSEDRSIKRIVIVGGGTAGWSAAAMLARLLKPGGAISIHVIESADVPTIGVGEATIPPILDFLELLGIDLGEFARRTQATFKLAIRFKDWLEPGHTYWHPFGGLGVIIERRPFQHYWWKALAQGEALKITDFSPTAALAEQGRFAPPSQDGSFPGASIAYALHFDAGLVAQFLREYAEARGVVRLVRTVTETTVVERGHIGELVFADGERLAGDLFIDCSGFRGVLIEQALKAGYNDWSRWLPCDRAVAAPTALTGPTAPYTESMAREAGWQWRIPLQHRMGNGYVYSSHFIEDQAAADRLVGSVTGEVLAEPRFLRFVTGARKAFWKGNCVAIGLSAGFVEPLESTSIHLIASGLHRLLDYFPTRDFEPDLAEAYNRETAAEYEHIRDFVLLHYYPNRRHGEPFWDACRNQDPPDSLKRKIEMIQASGRVVQRDGPLFSDLNWFHIAQGMGYRPKTYDPLVDIPDEASVRDVMRQVREAVTSFAARARPHDEVLAAILAQRRAS